VTLRIVWEEPNMGGVWVVSDSRLSTAGSQGAEVLTDRGAKVLAVPTVLRRQTPLEVLGTPVQTTSLGLAYAGSSLIALQAYAAVVPLWSHLQTVGPEVLPPIRAYADHLQSFVLSYAREVCANNHHSGCQFLLLGWDAGAPGGCAFVITATGSPSGVEIEKVKLDLSDKLPRFFGTGAQEAREKYQLTEGGPTGRRPLHFIRHLLPRTSRTDVGGGVQVGRLSPVGFQLFFDGQPVEQGFPAAVMRYRGFDISDVSRVGDAFVNMPGIA
jgi:hypothetical protein